MESNLLIGSLAFSPCWRECSGCSVKNENPENPDTHILTLFIFLP